MGRESGSGRLVAFVLGAVAGAAAAMLLAPRRGEETRRYIAERGNALAADVQDRTEGWLDRGRDLLGAETRRVRDAFEAGREAMRDEIRRARDAPPA